MILSRRFLDQVISEEGQLGEIRRLRFSLPETTLYERGESDNSDFIETFLSMAEIDYKITRQNGSVKYQKM